MAPDLLNKMAVTKSLNNQMKSCYNNLRNTCSHLEEHWCSAEHSLGNAAVRGVFLLRMVWAVHPWIWPVSLRMLCVVRQNEIRQRRKLVDRALCCVCSVINV